MVKEPSGATPGQAANCGNHENQSNAPPSSLSGKKAKTVSEHPLGGPVNDDSDKARKEVTTTDRDLCHSLSVSSFLFCRLNNRLQNQLTVLSFLLPVFLKQAQGAPKLVE